MDFSRTRGPDLPEGPKKDSGPGPTENLPPNSSRIQSSQIMMQIFISLMSGWASGSFANAESDLRKSK